MHRDATPPVTDGHSGRPARPTIRDVARHAGVAVSTVSHALSGRRHVSAATVARIQAAIGELDYHPNALAQAMITGRSQTLGLVLPDIVNPFFAHVVRHETAQIAVEADATDPSTVAPAITAVNGALTQTLAMELTGPLASARASTQSVGVILHRRYNPEGLTRFNIVPGLLGIILTITMVMMTALAVTREYERGTMENLLAMPVKPLEVMVGKIAPYVIIGGVQVAVVLVASALRRRESRGERRASVHHRMLAEQNHFSTSHRFHRERSLLAFCE